MSNNVNKNEYGSIKEVLDSNGIYTGLTMGISMEPLIHHQKDNIIVVKPKGRLKKYDVPVYITSKGKYVMHRVIEVHDDHYIIVGDNLVQREYVTDDMIIGILVGFYKNGKHYVDVENSKMYKFYSKLWVALLPIRPIFIFINRGIRWVKRHIFKKNI